MNIPLDVIEKAEKSFKNSKDKFYMIKWRGKFIRVASGKALWPSKGAAKNALRNHFCSSVQAIDAITIVAGRYYEKRHDEKFGDFINSLIEQKIVEFVEAENFL